MFGLFYSAKAPMLIINGIPTDGVPDYPSVEGFPPTAEVPLPAIMTKEWSEPQALGFRWPASLPEHITLPDTQQNPALFAAAVETIRVANGTFKLYAPYPQPKPSPWKELVDDVAASFRKAFPDEGKFPFPPDMRTLFLWKGAKSPGTVYRSDGTTILPHKNRLWTIACKKFNKMNWEEKEKLLGATFKTYMDEDQVTNIDNWNNFAIRMFTRYFAHREHAINKETTPDWQPTAKELDHLFSKPENNDGVTLVDLHRTFINVKNIPEFIRRIERFAVFTPQPAVLGRREEESVYIRKPMPSPASIKDLLSLSSLSIPELLEQLDIGSELALIDILKAIAAPDLTTSRWILKTTKGPSDTEIWDAMGDKPRSLEAILGLFADQVWRGDVFCDQVETVAYCDGTTELWYRKVMAQGNFLSEEDSRKVRALQAMTLRDPLKMLGLVEAGMDWDPAVDGFVEKPPPPSPKRKRDAEDDGEEAAGEDKGSPVRAIKKARTRPARCAYPL